MNPLLFILIRWSDFINQIKGGLLFGPETFLKEFILTWWTCFENAILVQIFISNYYSDHQFRIKKEFNWLRNGTFGPDHVSKCNFGSLFNNLNLRFQVTVNSFKHFSGPKSIPPRRLFVIYKGLILIMKPCLKYTIIYSKVYDRGWKFTIFNTSFRSFAQNTRSQLKVYDHWRKVYDQIYLWLS